MSYKVKEFGEIPVFRHPVYLGIDQSYSGFALTVSGPLEYDCVDASGKVYRHTPKHHYWTQVAKFDGSGVTRLTEIRDFLTAQITSSLRGYKIADVAMEGYAFGSQMANMLGELGGMVKLAVYETLGIRPLIVPPTSLKKFVTGKGTGVQKNQMLLHTYKKWGVEFTDDNAADSYALARLVSGLQTTAYETEIYEKLMSDAKYRA